MKKAINIPINQDILKLIALLTMTLDHIGYTLQPSFEYYLRLIGRVCFPIFVFLLTFNLSQKDLFKKYIFRLSLFAVLTSAILVPIKYQIVDIIPFNIFWNFLLSVVTIYGIEQASRQIKQAFFKYFVIGYIFALAGVLSLLTDYDFFGFLSILSFYGWFKSQKAVFAILVLISTFAMNLNFSILCATISCLTSFIFLLPLTKSKKQTRFLKPWWLFYAYYPLHLAILYAIAILLKILEIIIK